MLKQQIASLISVTTIIAGLTSCAKPNYAQEVRPQNGKMIQQGFEPLPCAIQFSYSKNCLIWYWESLPQTNQSASLIFKVFRANSFDGSPVHVELLSSPQVIMEMPNMSYCSSPRIAEKLDTGTYRVKNLIFTMPGEWQLRISVPSLTTVIDEAKILWNAN